MCRVGDLRFADAEGAEHSLAGRDRGGGFRLVGRDGDGRDGADGDGDGRGDRAVGVAVGVFVGGLGAVGDEGVAGRALLPPRERVRRVDEERERDERGENEFFGGDGLHEGSGVGGDGSEGSGAAVRCASGATLARPNRAPLQRGRRFGRVMLS